MAYIKSITLRGFKSFVKETTVEFDRGFSCIVGPNGSGKSNISDGILFVLGKLGSKGLRAENSASLIYNGGIGGKPAAEASVELCLDNSDNIFPLHDKEIKITRIVRRNGISIYKINGEIKTRQEVIELLSKAGLSPHGFNIVLQDSISRFVEMKNEERRQVIENISGISMYEDRKKKALSELEKTGEKLKEISIILEERGKFLKNLERERQQALLYTKLKEDIEIFKAAKIIKQISRKENEAGSFSKNVEKEKAKLGNIKNEIIGFQKEASVLFNESEAISKKIEESASKEQLNLQKGIVEVKGKIASLEARKINLSEQIKSNLEREKQLVFDIEKNEKDLLQKKNELREKPVKVDIKNLGKEVSENEKKLHSYLDDLISKIRSLREKKVEKQELLNFLETVENVCLILKEIAIKVKESRDSIASPQKFETVTKLEIETGILENEIPRMKLLIKRARDENKKLSDEIKEIDYRLMDVSKEERSGEDLQKGLEKKFKDLFEKRNAIEKQLRAKEEETRKKESVQWQIESVLKQNEIERARIDEDINNFREELKRFEKFTEKAQNVKVSEQRLQEEICKKEERLEELGSINLKALEFYDRAKEEYEEIANKAKKLAEEKVEMKKEFMKTYTQIAENFTKIFSKLTTKGTALLELENKDNPFEEGYGLDVKIKLGKGKYLDTRSLSGGEKALTALSFIFAIQEFKPHYFYLLDEVEAALDKRNSERLAMLVKDYVKKAQYISITHNDAMISSADKLYGVSMQNGSSKVISLKLS